MKEIIQNGRVLNCVPSQKTEVDWSISDELDEALLAEPRRYPDAIDLRCGWWKVGDQGSTGSCVGWATADAVMRWHLVKKKLLKTNMKLSVRFVWMAAKETDEYYSRPTSFIEVSGTSLKAALDIVCKYGVVTNKILPFTGGTLYPGRPQEFYTIAAGMRAASYRNLGRNLSEWRYWLSEEGPILTRLSVDDTWWRVGSDGKLDVYQSDTQSGGHAIALVGYTKDHFIVRNSWGNKWADNGFAYASNAYAKEAFTEAYGLKMGS